MANKTFNTKLKPGLQPKPWIKIEIRVMYGRTHTQLLQSCVLRKGETWFLKICCSGKMNKISQIFYLKCQTWQMALTWRLYKTNHKVLRIYTERKHLHLILLLTRVALCQGRPTALQGQRENSRAKLKSRGQPVPGLSCYHKPETWNLVVLTKQNHWVREGSALQNRMNYFQETPKFSIQFNIFEHQLYLQQSLYVLVSTRL